MPERHITIVPAFNKEKTIGDTLHALEHQSVPLDGIVVVDNGSIDRTPDILQEHHEKFGVHVISEPEKGTGVASHTGFRYAIDELGADIVSRTDADTVPFNDWVDVIGDYFDTHEETQMLGGNSYPKRDEFYRPYDRVLWPLSQRLGRIGGAVFQGVYLNRAAWGHNLAIRKDAYDKVGGFPLSDISERDEDADLTKRVYDQYGYEGLGYDPDMKVSTSMRRIRKLGYVGLIPYYWNNSKAPSKERRIKMTKGNIDIR